MSRPPSRSSTAIPSRAVDAIAADGAGVIIYAKPDEPLSATCARHQHVDSILVAGLLRTAGVDRLRLLDGRRAAQLHDELRGCGLEVARTLAGELARALGRDPPADVDLAEIGAGVLDPGDEHAQGGIATVLASDLLVLASPTYKATYSGLLKAFLDRLGTGALAGKAAVPILLGGAPNHQLAIDVHFTPLLYELGVSVAVRGLFVLEADVPGFATAAAAWAQAHARTLLERVLG